MNCNEVPELAPLYVSGELDAARTRAVHEHLDVCSKCRREIESAIELDERLRDELLSTPVESSAVEQRVRATIAAEPRPRFSRRLRIAVGIAAMLLLVLAGFIALRGRAGAQPVEICSDAARDHLREIVRQEPRRWTSDRSGIDALSEHLGFSPAAVSKFTVPGYRLARGKLCRLDGRVSLHLVYSNGVQEFSLFLQPARDSHPAAGLYSADFGAEHAASIQSGQVRAVIVTGESNAAAKDLARSAASAL
jgi:anti-sigma factor RsiW